MSFLRTHWFLLFAFIASLVVSGYFLVTAYNTPPHAEPVSIDVDLDLQDVYYGPVTANYDGIKNVPMRLVLGSGIDWRDPNSGVSVRTDEHGHAHVTVTANIDRQCRDLSLSEIDLPDVGYLFRKADHLFVAAEIHETLYRTDVVPLPSGTLLDKTGQFIRDDHGRFSVAAEPELLNVRFNLSQGRDPKHWTLELSYERTPILKQRLGHKQTLPERPNEK